MNDRPHDRRADPRRSSARPTTGSEPCDRRRQGWLDRLRTTRSDRRLAPVTPRSACRVAAGLVALLAAAGCGSSRTQASSPSTAPTRAHPPTSEPAPLVVPRPSEVVQPPSPSLATEPVPLGGPRSVSYVGPYRFVRGPLVAIPYPADADDDFEVFLRVNRPLPIGRIRITVDGVGPALTAGATGVDRAVSAGTTTCYEVTIGDLQTRTTRVIHFRRRQIVSLRVDVRPPPTPHAGLTGSPPGSALARVVLGNDSFPAGDPNTAGSRFGFALLGCPAV